MPRRHPVPRLWLMTDERMGEALLPALRALPKGSGVVFRHYATAEDERRRLFGQAARIAARRGLVLIRAGSTPLGRGEAGRHHPRSRGRFAAGLSTWPAHNRREAVRARNEGAQLIFISPIFPTRSHPGAPTLGPLRASRIGQGLGLTMIALGGMNARNFRRLRGLGFHGWAGIDAFVSDQKRNAVPT